MTLSPARLACAVVTAMSLFWFIPDVYRRATNPERVRATAYYSAVEERFMVRTDTFTGAGYADESGNPLEAPAFKERLPFLYFAELEKQGRFPATVAGVPVTAQDARNALQTVQLSPRMWNLPKMPLNVLLDAAPAGAHLSLPPDIFRITGTGLDFIRCADGSLDTAKTARFAEALRTADVRFPLRGLGSNPNPLKPFDEGCLLVDAEGRVFRLAMHQGEPRCRATGLAIDGEVKAITVEEHPRRAFVGTIVTGDAVHLVTYDDTLVRLPLEGFDAAGSYAVLRSDPLNVTLASADLRDRLTQPTRYIATDAQYNPVHTFDLYFPAEARSRIEAAQVVGSVLSPLALRQFAPEEGRVLFRIEPAASLPLAALGCALSVALLVLMRRRTRTGLHWGETLFVAATGLPGLAGVLVFGPLATPETGEATGKRLSHDEKRPADKSPEGLKGFHKKGCAPGCRGNE